MYGGPSMHAQSFAPYGAAPGPYAAEHGNDGLGGGFGAAGKSPFTRRHRPTNLASLATCLFVPVVVFAAVYSLQSFGMHYSDPAGCKSLCFVVGGLVLLFGVLAFRVWWRRNVDGQDPKWYTFLFLTSLIAWIFAMVFGNKNFEVNTRPFLDITSLNVYPSVDPLQYRGQQLMDAGRIIFTEGSHLELSRSMGFRNLDIYCVAPITGPNASLAGSPPTYDFWAVGMNCCSGHAPDFHCGEYNNLNARSGLRLMRDGQRSYFRLAVQQAEAAYNIRAPHPVFLYWMQDPLAEINAYQDDSYKFWLIGMCVSLGVQLIFVIAAVVIFSKCGI